MTDDIDHRPWTKKLRHKNTPEEGEVEHKHIIYILENLQDGAQKSFGGT
jgi:hypothetical protein